MSTKRIIVAVAAFSVIFLSSAGVQKVSAASGDAIEYVNEMGYMNGYPDGSFGENKTINRAELAKILVSTMYTPAEIEGCMTHTSGDTVAFKDISRDLWFAPYVCVAAKNNMVSGYADSTFRAGNTVTFAEASKMILETFSNIIFVPDHTNWFAPYVTYLSDNYAIPKTVTSLVTPMTRGEIAEIIYRIDRSITDLPSNAYEPKTVCILEMEGRFYGKTAKDVFFYTPTHALYSGSGALMGSESRTETLIAGNGRLIAGADVKTFEGLEMGYYGKDAFRGFYLGMMLKDSDGKTFETIDTLFGYAKDKYSAYYQGQKVLGSDPETFVSLGAYFAKDKNNVYHFGQKFEGTDAATFEVINGEYQRDMNSGYFRGKKIEQSSGATFEVLNVSFAIDASGAFYADKRLPVVLVSSFEVLKDHYSADESSVYFEENMMMDADRESFSVLDDFYAMDHKHMYYGTSSFTADMASFQVLAKGYAKDKNTVYYKGGKITADTATFSVNARGIAKDKNHTFAGGIAQ